MAGHYGYLSDTALIEQTRRRVRDSKSILVHQPESVVLEATGLTHEFGVIGPALQSASSALILHFSFATLCVFGHVAPRRGGEISWDLLAPLMDGDLSAISAWQNTIYGNYTIVAVNTSKNNAVFFSDPFGGTGLVYASDDKSVYWSTELKFLHRALGLPVSDEAIQHFLAEGYYRSDQLALIGARAVPAGQVLQWSRAKGARCTVYKQWDAAQASTSYMDARNALMGWLQAAVGGAVGSAGARINVSLSGGLDSRAILCLTAQRAEVMALTYGVRGSVEVEIARRVASSAGASWKHVPLDISNWMKDREDAVWMTDGQIDLKHLHILPLYKEIAGQTVIDGLLGDLTLGRGRLSWGPETTSVLDRYIFRCDRFTRFGPLLASNYCSVRMPLVDPLMVDFVEKQQSDHVEDGRLYRDALGQLCPSLFAQIPYNKTGRPPYPYRAQPPLAAHLRRVRFGLSYLRDIIGLGAPDRLQTMNYVRWIRHASFRRFLREKLYSSDARLGQRVALPPIGFFFAPLRPRRLELATRHLTVELWLRKLGAVI